MRYPAASDFTKRLRALGDFRRISEIPKVNGIQQTDNKIDSGILRSDRFRWSVLTGKLESGTCPSGNPQGGSKPTIDSV